MINLKTVHCHSQIQSILMLGNGNVDVLRINIFEPYSPSIWHEFLYSPWSYIIGIDFLFTILGGSGDSEYFHLTFSDIITIISVQDNIVGVLSVSQNIMIIHTGCGEINIVWVIDMHQCTTVDLDQNSIYLLIPLSPLWPIDHRYILKSIIISIIVKSKSTSKIWMSLYLV